jgi:exopolysaccharide biosynthesis polyprenyl glycosylphosphotransferase
MNLPLLDQNRDLSLHAVPVTGLVSSFERRRLRFYLGQMVADVAALFAAYLIADYLYLGMDFFRQNTLAEVTLPAQLLLPVFLTIALYNGSYSLDSLKDWKFGATRALAALAISTALFNFIVFFIRTGFNYSRITFIIAFLLTGLMFVGSRRLSAELVRRRLGRNPLNVLVIDDGGPPVALPDSYFVNARERGLSPALDDPHALDLLARHVRNMDQVIVSCPPERRLEWANVLKGAGVHGEVLFEFMREIGALGVIQRAEINTTTLLVSAGPLGLRARAAKRLLDVAVSIAALIVAVPILAIAAAAIKLEDRGPILFRQNRVGRRNQLFSIYKLRTMKVDRADGDGRRSASKDDDRVTRVGRWLRRTSIDELPQLFNVLRGDMSLVGPRPHATGSLAGEKLFWEVDQRYWQRHSLRPGLTGLAQIRGFRGATDHEDDLSSRLQSDLEYINGWTILRDVRILLATAMVLFHDRAF